MFPEKKDFLFRGINENIRKQILLDEEANYSTTDQVTATKIAKDISKFVNVNSNITDATACIGGSAYSLSKYFNNIIAIEKDIKRYDYLVHNMQILSVADKVKCIYGDSINICKNINQYCIFIDPPWGGPEYKTHEKVDLFISEKPLHDVCYELSEYTKIIALKVPKNFNIDKFSKNIENFATIEYKNYDLRKMHLIIIRILK